MSKSKRTSKVKRPRAALPRSLKTDQIMKAAAAYAARFEERLAHRGNETAKIDTDIPELTLDFLDALYSEPNLVPPDGKDFWTDFRCIAAILAALRAAYRQGCREGYIEGFVARRKPDLRRSKTGNDSKRKTLIQLPDGRKMTRDERDAIVVAEYGSLLALKMKPTPAKQRLADKYGFESWQGVSAAIKSYGNRASR